MAQRTLTYPRLWEAITSGLATNMLEGGGVNDGWERNFGYHEYVDNGSSMNIRRGGDPIIIYAFHVSAELCAREYRARGQAGGWWRQE